VNDLKKFFVFLVLFLFVFSAAFAVDLATDTNTLVAPKLSLEYGLASGKINRLQGQIAILRDDGFAINRLADELFLVKQLLENNKNKEIAGTPVSYVKIFEKVDTISKLIQQAKLINDELVTLQQALDDASVGLDVTQAQEIFNEAKQEFTDQRYEVSLGLIDATYDKILELQSFQAKTSAIYDATSKNIISFVDENKEALVAIIIIPIIIYLVFRKKIKRRRLSKKIRMNEMEIDVLKNEIKNTQQKYFVTGGLSESEYTIKMNIYSEKIRNLNKDTALLQEELAQTRKLSKAEKALKNKTEKSTNSGNDLHIRLETNKKELRKLRAQTKKEPVKIKNKK
jgi:hypothetical protein